MNPPIRWLLLTSPNTSAAVTFYITADGGLVVNPPDERCRVGAWHPGDDSPAFEAAVIDHNAGKNRFFYSGFLRGRGYPVVYIYGCDRSDVAGMMGCYTFHSAGDFGRRLARDTIGFLAEIVHEQRANGVRNGDVRLPRV